MKPSLQQHVVARDEPAQRLQVLGQDADRAGRNPFGDGDAGQQIVQAVRRFFTAPVPVEVTR